MLKDKAIALVLAQPERITAFWSNVKKSGSCWEWTKYRDRNGYGFFYVRLGVNQYTDVKVSRLAWAIENGRVPAGLTICHHCDNPSCCRPDHLFAGSQKDNLADMWRKGRGSRGAGRHNAILSDAAVDRMRRLYVAMGKSRFAIIARKYGVDRDTAKKAILGHGWKHVEYSVHNNLTE